MIPSDTVRVCLLDRDMRFGRVNKIGSSLNFVADNSHFARSSP